MTIIGTPLPPSRGNRAAMLAQRAAIEAEARRIMAGGPQAARDRHVKRGKLLPRDRVAGCSTRLALSGNRPLCRQRVYEDDIRLPASLPASVGHGPRLHDRLQRRHCERRDLLSADGEEAFARAGDRRRKPAALPLSRGFGGANLPNQDEVFRIRNISAASSTIRRA